MENLDIKKLSLEEFGLKYTILDKIGEGAFSNVYLCKDNSDNKKYVMKCTDLISSADNIVTIINEITVYKILKCECPNIICVNDMFINQNKVYIIFDYIEESTEFTTYYILAGRAIENKEVIPPIYYSNCFKIFKGVALALKYMHEKNILHLDIKMDNILIQRFPDGIRKGYLFDFGLSCLSDPPSDSKNIEITKCKNTYRGSYSYNAPEMIFKKTSPSDIREFNSYAPNLYKKIKDVPIDTYTDIFTFGLTIFLSIYIDLNLLELYFVSAELLKLHEFGMDKYMQFRAYNNHPMNGQFKANMLFKDLVCGMLKQNPTERIKIDQVITLIDEISAELDK